MNRRQSDIAELEQALQLQSRRADDLQAKVASLEFDLKQLNIPMVLRPTGRTIPDLTKREHICEWQSNLTAKR